ncbi:hypothetical protein BGZ97_010419 [Linnemannia gamsii]|uniref:Arrestin C-terminal-like domain-containing protein n=1 Tax=Linnemannia gamsii TaxID=64522 RepID=A0A9P6UNX3_9FUNG|nr:hypothetical protein BGZ97_010419 [Linnemannia gamsii]
MLFNRDKKLSLQVYILTPFRGPGNLPAIYGTPEEPPKIRGYVELITKEDVKASDLDLYFRVKSHARWARHYGESTVVYKSKEVLQKNFHQFPIKHERPGIISPGTIRFDFEEVLNKHTPSSIHGRRSWLSYRFAATLHRGFFQRNMVFTQDVWVFNTCIPSPRSGYQPTPHVFGGVWESQLPFTCSIPNETIMLGETVPLTIQFRPFVPSSGLVGQELVVVDAVVKMKQYTRLWHKWNVKNEKKVVIEMPVSQGWTPGKDGMQRTIMVSVPFAPRLSCTTITEPVRKTHCLKLIMRLKAASMSDKHAKELRIEMPVNITGPRPPTVHPPTEEEELLPSYSSVWEGGNDSD